MKLHEEFKLYETMWEISGSLTEDFDVYEKFQNELATDFNKTIQPYLQKATANLNNPNYVELLDVINSYVFGYKVCLSIAKQLSELDIKGGIVNVPIDEGIRICNILQGLVNVGARNDEDRIMYYLKNPYEKWVADVLKKDFRQHGAGGTDVEKLIAKLNFDPKEKLTLQPNTDKVTQEKPNDNINKTVEPKNAKLNRARQANLKIIKAFKEIGLATDDLTVTAKNKNGKDYRKASDKLNKLRKTLFGESLDVDEEIEIED